MLRGHVAHQRGGRRHILSAINAEAARLWGPYIRLGPLAAVMGHKPRAGQGLDTCQHWTLTHVGVLPVPRPCQCPDLTRRDLRPTRVTRHAFLGAPDLYIQGSGVPLWRSRPNDASWGLLPFLATWCPLDLPTWWGRVLFSVWPGDVVCVQRLQVVEEGTPVPGYRQWPRARLRGGCEPAGGARV